MCLPSQTSIQFTSRERDFVLGVAMKYMRDEEEAAEVAQEAMLLAYRHRDSFQGLSRPTTWLYRIAATTALMQLRKRRRRPITVSIDAEELDGSSDEPRDGEPGPESQAAFTQAMKLASEELSAMGDKYGPIFSMRFVEGFSETEIARRLNLSVSTVKTRAYRARNELRRRLEARGYTAELAAMGMAA